TAPSTFVPYTTLFRSSRTGSGLNSAIYLGDTWRHSRALQVTYGVRVEASDFQGHPAYNPEIEQLFSRRTDKFPTEVSASPKFVRSEEHTSELQSLRHL